MYKKLSYLNSSERYRLLAVITPFKVMSLAHPRLMKVVLNSLDWKVKLPRNAKKLRTKDDGGTPREAG